MARQGISRFVIRWVAAGLVAAPLAVLTHEAGHYLAYRAVGLPEARLHFDSASHALEAPFWAEYRAGGPAAAGRLVAPWRIATGSIAGLAVTYALVLASCLVAARTFSALAVMLALASNVRAIPVGAMTLASWETTSLRGTDEAHVAALTGVPEFALVLVAAASLLGSAIWIFRRAPRPQRPMTIAVALVGLLMGFGTYMAVGPWVLP